MSQIQGFPGEVVLISNGNYKKGGKNKSNSRISRRSSINKQRKLSGENLVNNIKYEITPLGKLNAGNQIIIQAIFDKTDTKVYGLNVEEKTKNITLKKDIGKEISQEQNVVAYQKNVTILGTDFPYTKADQNCLTILETQDNGKFKYWESSVINQNEQFYFVVQKVYSAQCFKNANDEIVCPYFSTEQKNWPQLVELLKNLYANKKESLALSSEENVSIKDYFVDRLSTYQGEIVLWWNFRRNSGCILTAKGPAKVYWKNIKSVESPVYLTPN